MFQLNQEVEWTTAEGDKFMGSIISVDDIGIFGEEYPIAVYFPAIDKVINFTAEGRQFTSIKSTARIALVKKLNIDLLFTL